MVVMIALRAILLLSLLPGLVLATIVSKNDCLLRRLVTLLQLLRAVISTQRE